jgi:hypothetical protein
MAVPKGHGKLAGGEARNEPNHRIRLQERAALKGRKNLRGAVSAALIRAKYVTLISGGSASLHHRLISQTPPASEVHNRL